MSSGAAAAVGKRRTRVGNYEFGKTLGEGSFAKVKFAKNIVTGDPVAIKIIDRDRILKHKMVEQVMASKTKIYIVLEYVDGGELFDKIPENLLLDSNDVLKVSDFGLSQQVDNGMLHTACGTPNYVAPEVLTVKGYNGAASDIWSCGVILFVLMAGYLPFDEENLMGLYRKIEKADYRCPPWFSSGAKKLLERILDPNPLTRITIPQILENDWFKKGYKPPHFEQEEDVNLDDVDAVFNESKGFVKRETSFASKSPANEIMSKIEEAAKPLGFNVHKRNYKWRRRCTWWSSGKPVATRWNFTISTRASPPD
ncbi:NAF domain-containing protein [Cynara cardunculus var. scolymus]|uniref:NAF domain-containing protein n=1 Tax=Cynara cardunculus var. scolymus TaxID=59895 RepID=A0A124SDL9_CYNCS|nr:NAF domain-containing protein [Cynara cardunculus var. scolymus]